MHFKNSALATAISLASVSTYALSDTAIDESHEQAVDLSIVTVTGQYSVNNVIDTATGLGLTIKETPQSVSVMTEQRIQDQSLDTVVDTIKNTIGVSHSSWDNVRNDLQARGFKIENYQIDGVPMAWSILGDSGETIADVSIYERVEFVRGSTGLLTGTGDPSGSINLVRKDADSVDFNGQLSTTVGSWNHKEVSADIASGLSEDGTLRGRVVAKAVKADSYTDLFKQNTQVFYGVIEKDLSPSTLVRMGISYQHDDPTAPVWGGLQAKFNNGNDTDWDRSVTTAADWTKWETTSTNFFTNLNHMFNNGWEIAVNYNHMKYESDSKLLYMYDAANSFDEDTGSGLTSWPYKSDGESTQHSLDVQLSGKTTAFNIDADVVIGALYSEQKSKSYSYAPLTNAFLPVTNFYDWDGNFPQPEWSIDGSLDKDIEITNKGAYAATRLHLTDDLKIILGGRVTSWNRKGDSYSDTGDYGNDNVFVPYTGILYDLNDDHRVYLSYAETFNPQNKQDMNDKLLDPLVGKTYEAGLKSSYFNRMLQTSVSVFKVDQNNVAVQTGTHPDDATRAIYAAAENVISKGYELEVIGQPIDGLNINAGYSEFKVSADDSVSLDVNTNQPRKQVNVFATYKLVNSIPKLTLGGGVNWQDKTYENDIVQDAYKLISLMGRYDINNDVQVQFNVDNLLDEKYYSYINSGQVRYGAPANWKLAVKYNF
jgi:outer membrane receptor for ferric coprogen and ferric-rhodotorulic acid